MNSSLTPLCKNCELEISGLFCSNCGQKVKEADDRSVLSLLSQFFSNLFFLDNRIIVSAKYLLFKPGKISKEFLEGKRIKFLPPITLFLFVNVIYFLVSPSKDYSLSLYDQMNSVEYSTFTNEIVLSKIESSKISLEKYAEKYNRNSPQISKALMILNVPIMAALLFLLTFKARKFYYDSLLFSLHFFTFFLICTLLGHLADFIDSPFRITSLIFILLIPLSYSIISVRRYFFKKWFYFLPVGILNFLGIFIALFFYRAIIFAATYLWI